MRQAVIHAGVDGYRVAECPSLPGCISQEKTREEAIANIREAIAAYIAALCGCPSRSTRGTDGLTRAGAATTIPLGDYQP